MAGATCGLEGSAISRALGTGIAAPIFSAFCTTREVVPFIFGFMVAAKIGGGIVAQLGSMRVNEEVDAMEVMGVPSITYLVSTRLLAAAVMLPIAYLIGLAAAQGAAWLASFVRFGDVSQGTWEFAFYTALDPVDILYSVIKGMVLSLGVVLTALYYGYPGARGPGRGRGRDRAVDGREPRPGDGPQHADDLHLLGVRPEPAGRVTVRAGVLAAIVVAVVALLWTVLRSRRKLRGQRRLR